MKVKELDNEDVSNEEKTNDLGESFENGDSI